MQKVQVRNSNLMKTSPEGRICEFKPVCFVCCVVFDKTIFFRSPEVKGINYPGVGCRLI